MDTFTYQRCAESNPSVCALAEVVVHVLPPAPDQPSTTTPPPATTTAGVPGQ